MWLRCTDVLMANKNNENGERMSRRRCGVLVDSTGPTEKRRNGFTEDDVEAV